MNIKENIQDLLAQVADLQASNAEQLEALRIKYLSKKGLVTELFNAFREVPKEEKREIGQALNALRQSYEARLNEMREAIRLLGEEAKGEEAESAKWRTRWPVCSGCSRTVGRTRSA